jgi:hypothetical protein
MADDEYDPDVLDDDQTQDDDGRVVSARTYHVCPEGGMGGGGGGGDETFAFVRCSCTIACTAATPVQQLCRLVQLTPCKHMLIAESL